MKNFLKRLWKEEDGAETAEWIVIVALLVAVGIIVYTQVLQPQLNTAVSTIGSTINSAAG